MMKLNRLFLVCLAMIGGCWLWAYVVDLNQRADDQKFYAESVSPHLKSGDAFPRGGDMDQWLERTRRRNDNAAYLTSRLKGCPAVIPQKLYPGTASGSFYLYAMSYKKEHCNDVDRARFLKAVEAEGVSLSPYIERGLHREPWVQNVIKTRSYQKMYSAHRLQQFIDEMNCPNCDRVCQEMAMIWASGPLLATHADMDDIADAILKVYENRDKLSAV